MKRNVLIFHGTGGSPEINWFPWLKNELEKRDCQVFVPRFPTPNGQSLNSWLKVLNDYQQYINSDTILIGHSLGGLFLTRIMERLENPVFAAFFVSASIGVKPIKFYESDRIFSDFDFDWEKIKSNAKNFFVYHSDNDPYVCLGNGEELAKKLGVELSFIPQAGHLNSESGYTKFDKLLTDIESILIK